jgi:hypothetical protein
MLCHSVRQVPEDLLALMYGITNDDDRFLRATEKVAHDNASCAWRPSDLIRAGSD